jgi:hypothetical protein
VQVVGVAVEQAGPLQGLGLQLVQPGRADETADSVPVQTQGAGDRRHRRTARPLLGDRLVALPGAGQDRQLLHRHHDLLDLLDLGGGRGGLLGVWNLAQAVPVGQHGALQVPGQVVPQVPAIRDLYRLRAPRRAASA